MHRWLFQAIVLLTLSACASHVERTYADGSMTKVRVGFGNKISLDGTSIEPSELVINATERVATRVADKASEKILAKAIDGITTVAVSGQ